MLQFVFGEINIWKLSGKSRIGAKEVLDLPPLQLVILDRPHARIWGQRGSDYFGVSPLFASSCTDCVVADLSIFDLLGRPHEAGGFVICFANTR
jgi:hypothetical protein